MPAAVEPDSPPLPPQRLRALLAKMLAYAARQKWGWIRAVLGVIVSTAMLMAVIWLFSPLLDLAPAGLAVTSREASLLRAAQLLGLMLGLTLAGNLLNQLARAHIARLAQTLMTDLRADYAASLLRQSPAFYHRHDLGELLSTGLNEAEEINEFLMDDLPTVLNSLAQFMIALGSMFYQNVLLALGSVAFSALIYGLSLRRLVPRSRRLATAYNQVYARVSARLNEALRGARDIQLFAQQRRVVRALRAELVALGQYRGSQRTVTHWNGTIFSTTDGLTQALIYGLGILAALRGLVQLTSGQLVSFVGLFASFNSPIRAIGETTLRLQAMLVAADQLFEIMDTPAAIVNRPNARDPGRLKGHIRFEDVSFSYAPGAPAAWEISHINLDIHPGEKVAIVGGSGSGKSALLHLIARFYDVTSGRVTIDGQDVRALALDGLRRNLGLVAREVMLFSGTLADNIRFARPDASQAEIERAAQIGHVTEFLPRLAQGYATELNLVTGGLSPSQQHRVSLARAALTDPPILLLDETTTTLDATSETAVSKKLDEFSQGRTTLIVTRRLATIKSADKIVVLGTDKFGFGMVKAVGTHDELLEHSPDYVTLYGQIKKKSILLPIGPRYDTTPALPTVLGLAQADNAPIYVLDFGELAEDADEERNFGVTMIPGHNKMALNVAHAVRVHRLINELRSEGLTVTIVRPADKKADWVTVTIRAAKDTDVTHIVAVDNVLVPFGKLRESIRTIERKAAVEYILVNPIAGLG